MPSLTDIVEGKFIPPNFKISSTWKYEVLERYGKFIPTLRNITANFTHYLDKNGYDWHENDKKNTMSLDTMTEATKFCWFAFRNQRDDKFLEKAI